MDNRQAEATPAGDASGYRLTLELSHPDCWMLEATTETDARLLVNAVYLVEGNVKAHVVAHATATETIDDLVAVTRASEHTFAVTELHSRHDFGSVSVPAKQAMRGLLVQYDPDDSIHDALVSRGFMPQEPIRIREGDEYWTVAVDESRERVQAKLDAVRQAKDAAITVQQISARDRATAAGIDTRHLSNRQREVFELARSRGYYDWPREVSASDLAEELDVSKATLLEHLRKAESKLLDPQ
jgi:predicted DNA binding protein